MNALIVKQSIIQIHVIKCPLCVDVWKQILHVVINTGESREGVLETSMRVFYFHLFFPNLRF